MEENLTSSVWNALKAVKNKCVIYLPQEAMLKRQDVRRRPVQLQPAGQRNGYAYSYAGRGNLLSGYTDRSRHPAVSCRAFQRAYNADYRPSAGDGTKRRPYHRTDGKRHN